MTVTADQVCTIVETALKHQEGKIAARFSIIERRMLLLVRAMRNEFRQAPIGEFEAQWAAIDPTTPVPPIRMVKHPQCECADCMAAWEKECERPNIAANKSRQDGADTQHH